MYGGGGTSMMPTHSYRRAIISLNAHCGLCESDWLDRTEEGCGECIKPFL